MKLGDIIDYIYCGKHYKGKVIEEANKENKLTKIEIVMPQGWTYITTLVR